MRRFYPSPVGLLVMMVVAISAGIICPVAAQGTDIPYSRLPGSVPAAVTPTPASGNASIHPAPFLQPSATPPIPYPAVCISELMVNPISPQGTHEYVELYNISGVPLVMTGWHVLDATSQDTLIPVSGSVLQPGQLAVILPESYDGFYDAKIDAGTLRFTVTGTIGNGLSTSDTITITNADQAVMGTYASTWDPTSYDPESGRSVEIADYFGGDHLDNYHVSFCPADGTGINSAGAANCDPYSPTPFETATPTPVQSGTPAPTQTFAPHVMCISEVMISPYSPQSNHEYVEVRNTSAAPIDMAGWYIFDSSSNDALLPFVTGGPTVLPPDGFGIILPETYDGFYDAFILPATIRFRTTGTIGNGLSPTDRISIRNGLGGDEICTYAKTWEPFNPPTAQSVEIDNYNGPDAQWNYHLSYCDEDEATGIHSAGAPNCSVPTPTQTPTPTVTPTPTATLTGTPPTATPTPQPCDCGLRISEVMSGATKVDPDGSDDDNDFVELFNCSQEPWNIEETALYIWDGEG
ncbi:lamin tail domain-containing protein, partial [bacterium]|nr:lamin tail domain-containing protein [candidate division CSSED10-310 bacterium]